MGKCKYCGNKTPFFKLICKDCQDKRKEGYEILEKQIVDWYQLPEEDRSIQGIINETVSLYNLNSFEKDKLYHRVVIKKMQEAIADKDNLLTISEKTKVLAGAIGIENNRLKEMVFEVTSKTVDDLLEGDTIISEDNERVLVELLERFNIAKEEYQEMPFFKQLLKAIVLREVMNGNFKTKVNFEGTPFNLQKGEDLIWVFENVDYLELKTITKYKGGSAGVSFRVAKGIYFRTILSKEIL